MRSWADPPVRAPEKVWAALTWPERRAAWAPRTADRDLAEAGDATLTMIDGEQPQDVAADEQL